MENANTFDQWCIVELFGRQVIVGKVTEQTIGGAAFVRVDVPELGDRPAFTRFYGPAAIYAMTPVSEDVARLALNRYRPEPVTVYVPELRQLAARATVDPDAESYDGDNYGEGYDPDDPDLLGDDEDDDEEVVL